MSGLGHVYRRSCRGGRPIHPRVYEHVLEWNLASLRSLGVGRCLCIAMPLQALPAGATPSSREGGTPGFLDRFLILREPGLGRFGGIHVDGVLCEGVQRTRVAF